MQEITTNFFKKRIFFFIIKAKKAYYARINRMIETDSLSFFEVGERSEVGALEKLPSPYIPLLITIDTR